MHLSALECIVASFALKIRDKKRDINETITRQKRGKQKIPNKKRGEALPKKTSPPKRLRQNSPLSSKLFSGVVSPSEKNQHFHRNLQCFPPTTTAIPGTPESITSSKRERPDNWDTFSRKQKKTWNQNQAHLPNYRTTTRNKKRTA